MKVMFPRKQDLAQTVTWEIMDPVFRIKIGWQGDPNEYRFDALAKHGIFEKTTRDYALAEAKRRMLKAGAGDRPKGWTFAKLLSYLKKTDCDVDPSGTAPSSSSGKPDNQVVRRQWCSWDDFPRCASILSL